MRRTSTTDKADSGGAAFRPLLRAGSERIWGGGGTSGKRVNDASMTGDAQAIMKKADRALDGLGDSGPITAVGVVANGLF